MQVAGERIDSGNVVKLQLVGTLLCNAHDVPEFAILEVPLVDEHGKREDWPWHLLVDHDWPESECLPCDLVSVEGQLAANGAGEPQLMASRVRVLRRDITGEQRELLLKCKDTVKRWDRARRMSAR